MRKRERKHFIQQNTKIKYFLIEYVCPLILMCGLAGNILSFLAMIKVYKREWDLDINFH